MEGQTGLDTGLIGAVHDFAFSQVAHPLPAFAGGKVTSPGVGGQDFSASGDFEPLGNGLLGFAACNGFGHNSGGWLRCGLDLSMIILIGIMVFRVLHFGLVFLRVFAGPFRSGQWS